jgi:flagellar hook assembly protein FlgD
MDVYNIRGHKVRSLVAREFSFGEHSVVWDGRDDTGKAVGSGVYFYRMTSGEYSSVRKMILIK